MERKTITLIAIVVLGIVLLVRWCSGSGTSSVESLYGTYTGTDRFGNKVEIRLKSESKNEWTKYGEDWSDNLVYKDSKGKTQSTDWQLITWTWDLKDGYIQTFYNNPSPRRVIDVKGKKIYQSWGEYLDKRNGFSYTKH